MEEATGRSHPDWIAPTPSDRDPQESPPIPPELFRAELEEVRRRRVKLEPPAKQPEASQPDPGLGLVGLAISGGGIRSATFALGVCQYLAREGVLRQFDYLSTVSGGGYLGASLSWLLSPTARKRAREEDRSIAEQFDLDEGFPYGFEDPESQAEPRDKPWQRKMLRYLRSHGNYLSPGSPITILSGVGALLRGLVLNLLVWLPLLVALLVLLFWLQLLVLQGLGETSSARHSASGADPLFQWPAVVCCQPCESDDDSEGEKTADEKGECLVAAAEDVELSQWPLSWALYGALLLVAVFLVFCIAYSLATWLARRKAGDEKSSGYARRRRFSAFCHYWLLVAIALLLLGSLPVAARALGAQLATQGSILSILLGIASGVASFFQTAGSGAGKKSRVSLGLVATVGAVLLLYGLLFLAYRLAFLSFDPPSLPVAWNWILLGMLAVAAVTGYFVNLNEIGLHRFYRDRLMETFMPPVEQALANRTGPTRAGDAIRMSELKGDDHRGPYHLVDTNLVLVDSKEPKFRMRGGDSFILSPRYCGSGATGYLPTESFMNDQMTLATAMAISGAAAHPNTGAGGTGPTRAKAVSLLMALLNVRLGYWIRHPKKSRQRSRTPSHFLAMLYEVFPWGYRETRPHLQLSDGGHFENLALYELVRRKCKLIVVLDAAADPGFAFGDLQVVTRRIAADFGALIEWDDHLPFEAMIPKDDADYPQGTKVAERGYALAAIRYASGGESTLIYVKSTMIRGLSLRVRGYKSSHGTFPDQSTADQFFDEEQFEAYRDLGYQLGKNLLADPVVQLGERIKSARRA